MSEPEEVTFNLLPENREEITTCCEKNTSAFLQNWTAIDGEGESWVYNQLEVGDCFSCGENNPLYRLKSVLTPHPMCDKCISNKDIRSGVIIKCLEKKEEKNHNQLLQEKRKELEHLQGEFELLEDSRLNLFLFFDKMKQDIKDKKKKVKREIEELDFRTRIQTQPYAFLLNKVPSYIERDEYDIQEAEIYREAVTIELSPSTEPDKNKLYWDWSGEWYLSPSLTKDNIYLDIVIKRLKYAYVERSCEKITTTKLDNGMVKYSLVKEEDILIFRKKSTSSE
jgi:hypothetical protein